MSMFLIIEPNADGHRMNYVKWSAKALLDCGYQVKLITTPAATKHPMFQDALTYCEGKIEVAMMPDIAVGNQVGMRNLWNRHHRFWTAFAAAFKEHGAEADLVFIPYLDHCDKAFSVLGSPFGKTPWAGVSMRLTFHHAAMGIKSPASRTHAAERALYRRLLKSPTLRTLFVIDESLHLYTQHHLPKLAGKVNYLADPQELSNTMTREQARARLGVEARFLILLYGSLTARKGIRRLIEATISSEFPTNGLTLIAGTPDGETCALLESPDAKKAQELGRLLVVARHASSEEEEIYFRAADLVWLAYEGHYGSSGVLSLAAAAGVPVVGSEDGVSSWEIQRSRLGLILKSNDMAGAQLLRARSEERTGDDFHSFSARRTVDQFVERLAASLVRSPE